MTRIGYGIFTWDRAERTTDRYGTFCLHHTNYDQKVKTEAELDTDALRLLLGRRVHIVAEVLETRESGHIGDLFRGLFPETPNSGESIDLGTGELFTEPKAFGAGELAIGLKPDDGRNNDWLDPRKLYRLHDQTVVVYVEEAAQ